MTDALFSAERAEAAFIRQLLWADVDHATLAVCHGRYSVKDALHHVITFALGHAERAKVAPEVARKVAVALFHETLAERDAEFDQVLWKVTDAIREHPDDMAGGLDAAAVIVREARAPVRLIAAGARIATRGR